MRNNSLYEDAQEIGLLFMNRRWKQRQVLEITVCVRET